jgi:hypothetical protein
MAIDSLYPIESWGEIFRDFRQVENVRVDSSAERLDIKVRGQENMLEASKEALDDALYKFRGNPKEVVTYFLKDHGVLVYYQDTLVGFFDILGYSSFIEDTSIEEGVRILTPFLRDISSVTRTDMYAVKLDHWILSDSVILVIDTNRHPLFAGSLEIFLATCSFIMQDAIKHGFPLRGAIGGGDFYKDGELMLSSALVDAARYEKEQEWLGAVLTPTTVELVEKAKKFEIRHKGETAVDLSGGKFTPYVRYGAIPWKQDGRLSEKAEETYYIKPFDMAEEDWASKYLPDSFRDIRKIENSHRLYAQE